MTDPVADYQTAARGFSSVLAQSAGKLDRPSPCEGWTAKDIVDHVMGGAPYYAVAWGGTVPELPEGTDLATRFDAESAALAEVCARPGVLDQMTPSPLGDGEIPRRVMLGIFTTDTLIHTWDLAKAIGVEVELDPELLRRSWEGVVPMESVLRTPGIFGPVVDVPDDAPFQDRALGFFGRQA
jgi:uncharacterized protein (TIGR03086 family)